jgi:NAD(P)H-nitrite reductase large subunit
MKNYKYLIVGGGMTADAAAHGIRERDPNGSIGILSDESSPPYDRPPLSKNGAKFTVATQSGKSVSADAVVAGIGIEPEVGLAKPLGLEVANGIVVDAELRAKAPDIFAAGDVTRAT